MNASPEWATWSLHSTKADTQGGDTDDGKLECKATLLEGKGGASSFMKTLRDDIHESTWHEYVEKDESDDEGNMVDADDSLKKKGIDAVDLDALFLIKGDDGGEGQKADFQKLDSVDSGNYQFDPLSPVEAQELERALKLSKYIPPSAKEKEEEKQRMQTIKVISTKTKKEDPRRVGRRINEETGKRIYKLATGVTGMSSKENNKAKEVLQTMCASMLPKRHFEWILAQLTYNKCDMLGFENIPSHQLLIQEEAKESVRNESMPLYNLAYVTKLLADASKVDTSIFNVIDPTRSARTRGKPATDVKNKMLLQSHSIFCGLQELFPKLFSPHTKGSVKLVDVLGASTSAAPSMEIDTDTAECAAESKPSVESSMVVESETRPANANSTSTEEEIAKLFYAKLQAQKNKRECTSQAEGTSMSPKRVKLL